MSFGSMVTSAIFQYKINLLNVNLTVYLYSMWLHGESNTLNLTSKTLSYYTVGILFRCATVNMIYMVIFVVLVLMNHLKVYLTWLPLLQMYKLTSGK